ncbi:MAG: Holliday junction resolvase RuvX [candidate division KSB1 bacterium]|nr:Holliday junction resolvase RuvX [candidate division KSB1 bacterium]
MKILPADKAYLLAIPSGRILGIDYGEKRIGLAVSDPLQFSAFSLKTLRNEGIRSVAEKLQAIIAEQNIRAIVIGKPIQMSGEAGEMCRKAEQFANQLASVLVDMPIFLWDERWTTLSAERLLRETGRSPSQEKEQVDQIAAAYLLQSFLQRLDVVKRTADQQT